MTPAQLQTAPTARQRWRRWRARALLGGFTLLTALVMALLAGDRSVGELDPRAVDRAGSKALAQVLRGQGVQVQLVETTDAAVASAGAGSTLLVARPRLLSTAQLRRLARTRADLVLLAPRDTALAALAPGVSRLGPARPQPRQPDCALPAAARAGDADVVSQLYTADQATGTAAVLCYGGQVEDDDALRPAAPLVQLRQGGRTITVLGSTAPLRNDRLDARGNAALMLGLLGAQPRLSWYLPSVEDVPVRGEKNLEDLLPPGVTSGLAMLAVATVLLALWRGRRLGPVVAEPLPVVVRAAETTEGRARLYRRTRSRDRAAETLRVAARQRIIAALGLPRAESSPTVVAAVAARTTTSAEQTHHVLYGGAPADDAALVRLARELDALEREVRRT